MNELIPEESRLGELFEYGLRHQVYTVSELTIRIRTLLESQFGRVRVIGEISNLRQQNSGHWYFSLKDPNAQIACVLFRSDAIGLIDILKNLKDGIEVLVEGDLTVYDLKGQYQILVRTIEPRGIGALQIAFERLKAKLQAEGLFAPDRKRSLPKPLLRIGLVTSPTGAAIRDFLQISWRRFPLLEIIVAPCRVQGDQAPREIAYAIRLLNKYSASLPIAHRLQAIVVARGGGSLEDLWAFNEEIVARAIFSSELPVISAVGHEIDFTISDFVADIRAPTPSAAAEMVTEWGWQTRQLIENGTRVLSTRFFKAVQKHALRLSQLQRRLNLLHPRRRLELRWLQVDDLYNRLVKELHYKIDALKSTIKDLDSRLSKLDLHKRLLLAIQSIQHIKVRLRKAVISYLQILWHKHYQTEQRLKLLSPENTLQRGFSITIETSSGKILRSFNEITTGTTIRTYLAKGAIESTITKLCPSASIIWKVTTSEHDHDSPKHLL